MPMSEAKAFIWNKIKANHEQLMDDRTSSVSRIHLEKEQLKLIRKFNSVDERPTIGFPVPSNDICSHIIKDNHMFIEFEKESINPIFGDVADGQLFIDREGCLCQKSSDEYNEAWCIADENGKPKAEMFNYENFTSVTKILPLIKKISF
jgi:hypothetical protein